MTHGEHDSCPEGHDPQRWRLAQARVGFRSHATTCVLVNLLLIAVWFFTSPHHYFRPMWPMLGWGIGLASHGLAVYRTGSGESSVEREYRRLGEKV